MDKLNTHFKLNGHYYSSENLPDVVVHGQNPSWNTSMRDAIKEWYNDHDHIVMHSSGSTGSPKPIRLSKNDIIASVKLTVSTFGLSPGDQILCCLPLNYIAGRMMLYRGLVAGLDIWMVEPSLNPIQNLTQAIKFVAMTPMQVGTCLDQNPGQFDLVDMVLIGGAPITYELEQRISDQIKSKVYASYGMTETITHVAIREVGRQNYFEALQGVRFSIRPDQCLTVHVDHLSTIFFETTDIVDLISERKFIWKGRKDRVINVGGIKVSPELLEAKITSLVTQPFFITSISDDRAGEKIVLIIEDVPWTGSEKQETLIKIRKICTKYEQPKEIYFAQKFARTHTQKVDRAKTMKELKG